jgi:glycosyltransferase involved in cell wall biosynthesis
MLCKVSVIIPFYKNKRWLIEAIESVKVQSFKEFEIIVINDGSKEDILDLHQKYSWITFLTIDNSGPGRARNYGISHASGEYIAFLDSDDLWCSNKLFKQFLFMEENNLDWSHSNYIKFNENNDHLKKVNCNMEGKIIPKMFITCPIATPCVMIRHSILKKNLNLRFSENIRVGEDSYFWFKMAELYPLGFIDEYLTKVRIRGKNAALQGYLQLKSRADSYEFIRSGRFYFNSNYEFKLVKFGFLMSKICYTFITFLSKKLKLNASLREIISMGLYVFPYFYLKVISIGIHNKS